MNPTKNNYPTIAVLYLFISIALTLFMSGAPFSISAQAAPPTDYEGFGAVTRGALDAPGGYETFHVTNLDDNGNPSNPLPGSFRDAVSQGSRYIVFDVGGTITLTGNLKIYRSYITIDGSSAPSPGITIIQTMTAIIAELGPTHDIIIHHLRVKGGGSDIWGLDGTDGFPVSNIIIDHVTAIDSGDGIFDMTGKVSDVTLSWNLMMDTLPMTLVKYGGVERISFHHNVLARNNERQPDIHPGTQLFDHVNNVIYGWGWFEGGAVGLAVYYYSTEENNPGLNVENNVFHYVPIGAWTGPGQAIRFFDDDWASVPHTQTAKDKFYFNGNILPVGETVISTSERLPIPSYAEVTKYAASTLGDTVVPFAGTHYPTPEEQDLLNEISIAIGGQAAPIANAGPDQTVTDEDSDGSEQVTLDGSASRDPDGTIVSFIWSEESSQIATGINPTVTLSTGTHLITLTVTDNGGSTDTNTVTIKVLEGDKEFAELPAGCYNNVFNPAKGEKALIVVELPKQARVKLGLYNTRGNRIRELADEQKEAGTHKYYWDGKSGNGDVVGSGLYFVHIQAGDYKKTKKIVVVK